MGRHTRRRPQIDSSQAAHSKAREGASATQHFILKQAYGWDGGGVGRGGIRGGSGTGGVGVGEGDGVGLGEGSTVGLGEGDGEGLGVGVGFCAPLVS